MLLELTDLERELERILGSSMPGKPGGGGDEAEPAEETDDEETEEEEEST